MRFAGTCPRRRLNAPAGNRQQTVAAYKLAALRRELDRTQTAVAAEMNVSQKRVSEIEHGQLDRARLDTIRRYVAALGGIVHVIAEFPDDDRTITLT